MSAAKLAPPSTVLKTTATASALPTNLQVARLREPLLHVCGARAGVLGGLFHHSCGISAGSLRQQSTVPTSLCPSVLPHAFSVCLHREPGGPFMTSLRNHPTSLLPCWVHRRSRPIWARAWWAAAFQGVVGAGELVGLESLPAVFMRRLETKAKNRLF